MADPEIDQVGHQGGGVCEGELLMELQPHRRPWDHWRGLSVATKPMRRATASPSSTESAATGTLRRQLGCSVTVPGRLGCSSWPSKSSSGISDNGTSVLAMKR